VPSRVSEQVPVTFAAGESTAAPAEPAPTVVDCVATLPNAMLPPASMYCLDLALQLRSPIHACLRFPTNPSHPAAMSKLLLRQDDARGLCAKYARVARSVRQVHDYVQRSPR